MSANNRELRRRLDKELRAAEDNYLALRDLKSDGALQGRSIPFILQYDKVVECAAAQIRRIQGIIDALDKTEE